MPPTDILAGVGETQPDQDGRPARPEDIDEICLALPEVELGVSWGDRPTYKVRAKGFLLHRAPRHDAVDPATARSTTTWW